MDANAPADGIAAGEGRHEAIRTEIDRANARMRHFRAVAASLLSDALGLWDGIWQACEDPRTADEILEGAPEPRERIPACGWNEFREMLYALRHHLDHAKRLCDGSVS
jgi:hypothetical protein